MIFHPQSLSHWQLESKVTSRIRCWALIMSRLSDWSSLRPDLENHRNFPRIWGSLVVARQTYRERHPNLSEADIVTAFRMAGLYYRVFVQSA